MVQHQNMAKLPIIVFAILIVSSLSVCKPILLKADQKTVSVFETGKFSTELHNVDESKEPSSPSKPLLIVRPTESGTYPVLMYLHGTCLENYFYSDFLQHIASHGFIVVAPQLYSCLRGIPLMPIGGPEELDLAAKVANWLLSGFQHILPQNIKADTANLAVGGHSRGGKMAFALALGYAKTPLKATVSALIGLDPVEGTNSMVIYPKILTYVPNSLNLSIPVTVIGTGLGSKKGCLLCPPCAPNKMNHVDYYSESKSPATHFVTTDYGHMDMLNDGMTDILAIMANAMCKNSRYSRDPMRRTVGGIFVAFLEACLLGEKEDYMSILKDPYVAPARLDPVQSKMQERTHAQV